ATYYYPNGGTGACGWTIQNGDMSVAIGSGNWDNGAHCGATMTFTYKGKTIQATVADLCPHCQGSNGIDLTQGAMASMDPNWYNNGEDSVTWSVSY
ncbi:barwin-related endoglucanase, partial [Mycena sanguinolenta]